VLTVGYSGETDYFAVRPACGCITAWLSATSTEDERSRFFRRMMVTGRDVIRGTLDEYRERLDRCPHQDEIDEFVDVVSRSDAEALAEAVEEALAPGRYADCDPPRALAEYRRRHPKETP
jgi:hypothetical protein